MGLLLIGFFHILRKLKGQRLFGSSQLLSAKCKLLLLKSEIAFHGHLFAECVSHYSFCSFSYQNQFLKLFFTLMCLKTRPTDV